MTDQTREARLSRAFVTLADTLVSDFDLVDLLQTLVETSAEVLDATAAGLMLKDTAGALHVVASTTEDAEFVELVQLGTSAGPCMQCVRTGQPVTVADIGATDDRWSAFRKAALDRGFRSLQATPLRLRSDVIGTLNLFDTEVGALNAQDVAMAQALSDVATIGILSERASSQKALVNGQLQGALDSRVAIEQAKGVLAQSTGSSMDDAFLLLRAYARSRSLSLRAVAADLVARRLEPSALLAGRPSRVRPDDARRRD